MLRNQNKVSLFFSICTLAVMVMIFYLSSQTAEQSNELSMRLSNTILMQIRQEVGLSELRSINHAMRKFAHFFIFGVLGFFLCLSLSVVKKPKRPVFYTCCIGLIYSFFDEFHQYFVEGRGAQWQDVVLDFCGVVVGCHIAVLTIRCYKYFWL